MTRTRTEVIVEKEIHRVHKEVKFVQTNSVRVNCNNNFYSYEPPMMSTREMRRHEELCRPPGLCRPPMTDTREIRLHEYDECPMMNSREMRLQEELYHTKKELFDVQNSADRVIEQKNDQIMKIFGQIEAEKIEKRHLTNQVMALKYQLKQRNSEIAQLETEKNDIGEKLEILATSELLKCIRPILKQKWGHESHESIFIDDFFDSLRIRRNRIAHPNLVTEYNKPLMDLVEDFILPEMESMMASKQQSSNNKKEYDNWSEIWSNVSSGLRDKNILNKVKACHDKEASRKQTKSSLDIENSNNNNNNNDSPVKNDPQPTDEIPEVVLPSSAQKKIQNVVRFSDYITTLVYS